MTYNNPAGGPFGVFGLGRELGIDVGGDPAAMQKIKRALMGLADDGSCDSGGGMGCADFWVKIDGVEYYLQCRRSNGQVAKDKGGAVGSDGATRA